MTTIKKHFTEEEMKILKDYPIKDGHREHYVKYPYKLSEFEWVAVRCSGKGGYIAWDADRTNPTLYIFSTEEECKKACDIHNNYHFNPDNTYKGQKIIQVILDASFFPERLTDEP